MVGTVVFSPLAYLEMLGKRELYVKVVTNAFILMRISEKSLTTVPWRWLMNFKIAPRPSVIMSAALGRGCWSPNRSLTLLQRNIPLPLDFWQYMMMARCDNCDIISAFIYFSDWILKCPSGGLMKSSGHQKNVNTLQLRSWVKSIVLFLSSMKYVQCPD